MGGVYEINIPCIYYNLIFSGFLHASTHLKIVFIYCFYILLLVSVIISHDHSLRQT